MLASIDPNLIKHLWDSAKFYVFQSVVLIAVAVWLFVKALPSKIRTLRSSRWAIAQGRIETISVDTINTQREFATANLGYSYHVEGERFAGYYSHQFDSEQTAWEYANSLKNKVVVVRYNPRSPETSALRLEDQPSGCELCPKSDHFAIHFYRLLSRTRS
jgi:hypothetical protein